MWNKESIQHLLTTKDEAVARAVVAIYERQTADEKAVSDTRHHNDIGFNGSDGKRGSYYATYIKSHGRLTGRHLEIGRKMMMKYWRQLADIANEKEAAKAAKPAAVESRIEAADACDCENYDGEMLCPSCQVKHGVHPDVAYGNGFGFLERKQEAARAYRAAKNGDHW